MSLSRRTLMAGAATLAVSTAIPAGALVAVPQPDTDRLIQQMLATRMKVLEAQFADALEQAIVTGRGTVFVGDDPVHFEMFDEATEAVDRWWTFKPPFAAVDPSWTPPRSHG
jgi:hypothetical protein